MPPASLASGFAGFGLSSPATPQGGAATNPFGGMNSTPAASSSGFGFGQLATPSGEAVQRCSPALGFLAVSQHIKLSSALGAH